MSNNEEKQPTSENTPEAQNAAEEAAISPKRAIRAVFDILESFAFSAIAVLIICSFFCRVTTVDGSSMEDTLHNGEALLVSIVFYTPEPGDIIVLHQPSVNYPGPLVKRVIATEGQQVLIDLTEKAVYVDGVQLTEDYVYLDTESYNPRYFDPNRLYRSENGHDIFTDTVPEGMVFVMGDNRNHSADSRNGEIGLIDTRTILGKVLMRIYPFHLIGTVS